MQLNKNTGESYILNRVSKNNAVFYNKQDTSKAINVPLANLEATILEQAQIELGVDYVVSTVDYNWVYPLSAEEALTTVRLTIPSSIVNEDPTSAISQFIIGMSSTYANVTTKTQFTSTVYLTTIDSQYVDLLNPYVVDGEIIADKLENGEMVQLANLDEYKI